MRCDTCGTENPTGRQTCAHCGDRLPSAPAPDDARARPGKGPVAAAREELLDIAFALQELERVTGTGNDAALAARERLLARRHALHADLSRLYGALPTREAETRLVDLLADDPGNIQARLRLGEVYEQAGRVWQAVDQYYLAAAFNPTSATPSLHLAEMNERQRQTANALYFYRSLLAMSPDSAEARKAEERASALERDVRSEHAPQTFPPVPRTARGLGYLLAVLRSVRDTLGPGEEGAQQLVAHVAGQLRALQAPQVVTPAAQPALSEEERERLRREAVHIRWLLADAREWSRQLVPEVAAARLQDSLTARLHELEERAGRPGAAPARPGRDEAYERYALAQVDHFLAAGALDRAAYDTLRRVYLPPAPAPAAASTISARQAPVVAPAAPAKPPPPPAAPPVPREPFDWAAFWSALFSERTLTAILSFGVFLVALSSLFLLITMWGELDWWVYREALLLGQGLAFLGIGYVVKERLKLRLSGLALISIAALWVPLTVGAAMFDPVFTDEIREGRLTRGGYPTIPGLNLPLDLPIPAWLIIAATCVPAWALLTYRFRGHLLMHGTVLMTGVTLSLIGASLGLTWEWAVAGFGAYAVPILFIGQRLERTDLRDIARPLFWTSQAVLIGVGAFLFVAWAQDRASGYPLALVTVAGAGLALAAHRVMRSLAYEYAVAVLPVIALMFALSDGYVVPLQRQGAALAVLSVAYLCVARTVERRYTTGLLGFRSWSVLQPAYAVAYGCAAFALLWYWSDDLSRLGTLFVVAGVAAVSAWWSGRWSWTGLAGLAFSAAVLLSLRQVTPQLAPVYGSVALAVMAWGYLAGAVALRRAPAHAAVTFGGAQVLTAVALAWAVRALEAAISTGESDALSIARLAWVVRSDNLTATVLVLPAATVTYLASALLVRQGRDGAVGKALSYAAIRLGIVSQELAWRQSGSLLFLAAGATALMAWTALLRVELGIPAAWTGLDFMALAALYGIGAYRLRRAGLAVHAKTIGAIAAGLVVLAPFYQYDAAGISWTLTGMLYADAALAALIGYALRRSFLFTMAAVLLLVPFALTLYLSDLAPERWAVPWVLLAAAYFTGALALSRAPSAATPVLTTSYALTALALGWTLADPTGGMARLTLPAATGITAASAFLAHQRRPASLRWLLEHVGASSEASVKPERTTEIAAVAFGLLSAVLAPIWVALMLQWQGVDGAFHAYALIAWAFIVATLAHLWLRRHSGLYATAFLVYGALLAVIATAIPADPLGGDQVALTVVLYADAALSVAYRRFLQSQRPLYLAGGLLPLAAGLTLDVAGVPPRLWSTPLMALALAYVGLGYLVARRLSVFAPTPLQRMALGLSWLALAWAVGAFTFQTWTYHVDTVEGAFITATPLIAAAMYAVLGYGRVSRRFGHMASWTLAAFVVMALVTLEVPFRYVGIPMALAGIILVLPGLALYRAGNGANLDAVRAISVLTSRARAARVFGLPLGLAGYGLAGLAAAITTVELQSTVNGPWPSNAVYLIVVALLAASSYVARAPWYATGAAVLFVAPFSIGVHEVFGPAGPLALPDTALAFGWSALAVVYLAVGLVIERWARRYSPAFPALAYGLLLMAAWARQHSAARLSVYGVIVGVTLVSAYLMHRRHTTVLAELLARGLSLGEQVVRRYLTLGFVAVAALLSPLWLLEILALYVRTPEVQGLGLSVLAPAYVLAGAFIARRTDALYSLPAYVFGYAMTAIGPVLSADSYSFNVAALALATGTYALSGYLFRHSRWSHVAFAVLTGLFPVTVARSLSWFPLLPEGYGLALMAVALAYLGAGALGDRLAARRGASAKSLTLLPGSPWGHLDLPVGRTAILYAMGTLLTGLAAALAMPGWPRESLLSAAVYFLGAAYFGLASARFRSALLLYPTLTLAIAGYALSLAFVNLDSRYLGLGLLPGALLSLAIGWLLYRLGIRAGSSPRTGGMSWALPFLVVGYGMSVTSAILSTGDDTPRLVSLVALAVISAGSLAVFRSWVWSYPLAASAQMAFTSFVTLPFLNLDAPVIGILYVPAAAAMLACFGVATRGTGPLGTRTLADRRGVPYAAAGVVDIAVSLALAARADWAGAVVSASYAVLAGAAAVATQVRVLPYVSTAFITAAVIFTSRHLGLAWSQSAVVWSFQGFSMWWASRLCAVLAQRRQPVGHLRPGFGIWVAPLRDTGVRLSWFALAFVVAVFGSGVMGIGRLGVAQINDISAVLAVLSLLYVGMAFHSRKAWMGYVAVGLLLTSWVLQLVDRDVQHAQLYSIPAGLYLLGIAFSERRHPGRSLFPVLLDLAAVFVLLGSAFWQSTVDDPAWAYALLMGGESIVLVLWGAGNQTKLPFIGGILGFVIAVVYQTATLHLTVPLAGVGLIIGLLLIVVILAIEWKREELIGLGRQWSVRLKQWGW